MGSKLNPGKFDCYANALPDEPMFVLLARDPFAPELVRLWARTAELGNRAARPDDVGRALTTSGHKIAEAMQCADDMKRWREANPKPEGGYPVGSVRIDEPDGVIIVTPAEGQDMHRDPFAYMKIMDEGTDDECSTICAKGDPGAFAVYR